MRRLFSLSPPNFLCFLNPGWRSPENTIIHLNFLTALFCENAGQMGRGKEAARLVQYCNTYSKKIFHVNICSSCLAIYTSNSAVPKGGSEDERAHLSSPRVPSASERHDNNGLEKDEPFYSTVEELYSACRKTPYPWSFERRTTRVQYHRGPKY